MPEAIFNSEPIVSVGREMIDYLKSRALESPRKRFRLCLHRSTDDLTHEMLIAFHRSSYMPPHRHPEGKSESYHLVEGEMDVYFFNDEGEVIEVLEMGERMSGKPCLYRLSSSIWHMPKPTGEWAVYHEVFTGPFDKDGDVEFPAWAPQEEDVRGVESFCSRLDCRKTALAKGQENRDG